MFSHHFECTKDKDKIEKAPHQNEPAKWPGHRRKNHNTTTRSDLPACLHSTPAGYHHPTM
ncbi:unnamed protein product, partial [Ectocarpus sp. 12 AP-2014]